MPFIHGRNTEVLLGSKDLSGYFNAFDLDVAVTEGDTTTFKKSWKTYLAGLAEAKVDGKGLYDPLMTDIQALIQAADGTLSWAPGGATAFGDQVRMMAAVTGTFKESSPVGGLVIFNWSPQGNDTLGIGNSFHPLAAETVTGFSAYLDGLGVTLAGAVAHLHVTAMGGTGSPTLNVKFRDATSGAGAGLADIAGGAFSAVTAVGAQRLVIPGTIRQFVRVDWTITGTTPSFTFAVGFARKT